uniref:RRM domain-containing protein n=1 Tax=Anopheles christyi TaxID=43041 RepID=A0A182K1D0_9DIPT
MDSVMNEEDSDASDDNEEMVQEEKEKGGEDEDVVEDEDNDEEEEDEDDNDNDKDSQAIDKASDAKAKKKSECDKSNNGSNLLQSIVKEEQQKNSANKDYTVFIANLPKDMKDGKLRNLFSKYGYIVSLRFRTNTGKKIFNKKDLENVPSLIAYVRYGSKKDMMQACQMNGQMVGDNRIRVCPQDEKQIGDARSTVFVGNLHRAVTDNDLYELFSRAGEIAYVRLISAKYIAYVSFKDSSSVPKALKLNQANMNGREIRVSRISKEYSNVKVNKKGHAVPRNRLPANPTGRTMGGNNGQAGNYHGKAAGAGGKLYGTEAGAGGNFHGKAAGAGGKFHGKAAGAGDNFHGKVAITKHKKQSSQPSKAVRERKLIAKKLTAAMKEKKAQ